MSNLAAADFQMFEKLGIGPELLNRAGVERVDDVQARRDCKLIGPGDMDMGGITFPYFVPGGSREVMTYCRVRRDNPEVGADGKVLGKYMAPPKSETVRPIPYFPPVSPEQFADAAVPIILVEAEKSVLSLTAWSERTGHKILPIGLGGCWGWSAVIGQKEIKGEKVDVHDLHPDLTGVCRDRKVYVLLDANAVTNADVQKARHRLTAELRNIGALPHVLDLPVGDWNGPDDYLAAVGDQALTDLFDDQKTGDTILREVEAFLRRFIVMSEPQYVACTLWAAHTHVFDLFAYTPYLIVTSAEKQCAKSQLLHALRYLVQRPWNCSGGSAPVLFRKIAAVKPTLLLDEMDALLQGDKETAQAIRGILNAGHEEDAVVSRCEGKGLAIVPVDYSVFCPKALAGIGSLPETVRDRGVPIRMKRKLASQKVMKLRKRVVQAEGNQLRERLGNWANGQRARLSAFPPLTLEEFKDRQEDGAEPLFAIASCAAGLWPERCRRSLLELFGSVDETEDSTRLTLLADLKNIFDSPEYSEAETLSTDQLLERLKAIEASPWADLGHGKGLTRHALSKLLRPYEVYPGRFREKSALISGYQRHALADVWARYLPFSPTGTSTPEQLHNASVDAGPEAFEQSEQTPLCSGVENDVSLSKDAGLCSCSGVAAADKGRAPETAPDNEVNGAAPSPDPTPLSETVATLRRRFHYGEALPPARAIPCPPEVIAAVPPDDPEPSVPTISPEMLVESEEIRRHFQDQEAAWRADPHAPPVMPEVSMIPLLAAKQIEITEDDRTIQTFYGKPPDLRPGRGCDVGMADDESRRRRERFRARRGTR
jgi:hypothetical protein